VLQHQPAHVRFFLLYTSILERLSGELCDAVVDFGFWISDVGLESGSIQNLKSKIQNAQAMLEHLEHANLFLVPLDGARRWYRYHQLFADVLRACLHQERPEQVAALHSRASVWYERHGFAVEAVGHALAGRDWERAMGLIEPLSVTL